MADDLDSPELREQIIEVGLHSPEAERILREFAQEVATAAKALAPKRTGKMASRIRSGVSDSAGGMVAKISAPAPANLLATYSGLRHQARAWGHPVSLWHKAHDPFLKYAFRAVAALDDDGGDT